jgi:sterol desaturase/sphingolipid hydroxylase (fatty acid hydroxylase superfamily)
VIAWLGLTVTLTLMGLATGWAWERLLPKRKIFDVPLKRGQLRTEALGTVLFHLVFVPSAALATSSGALRFSEVGWLAEVASFGVPWMAFTLFYYPFHRALHTKPLFWIHRWHHESLVTTPMTGLSMHPLEAVGWVVAMLVPSIVLAQLGMLGAFGFGSFLVMHWVGNIAGHCNADAFPLRVSRASSWMSPPISYHSLHHARFDGHYGFASVALDRLLGTEFPDWKAVHDRAYDGRPLTSLREKVETTS